VHEITIMKNHGIELPGPGEGPVHHRKKNTPTRSLLKVKKAGGVEGVGAGGEACRHRSGHRQRKISV